jgi:hypothetical protein
MKGHYHDHEVLAKIVNNALKSYQLDVWMWTMPSLDKGVEGDTMLVWLETLFHAFCNLQLTSNDVMTRVAANFLKEFAAFKWLGTAIRCGDADICEK